MGSCEDEREEINKQREGEKRDFEGRGNPSSKKFPTLESPQLSAQK